MQRVVAALIVVVSIGAAVVAGEMRRGSTEGARCGPGFVASGTRCIAPAGFTVPDVRVLVPAASIAVGPSDWETAGASLAKAGTDGARTIHVDAFRIDAFEVTRGMLNPDATDPARAASGVTREDAAAFCASRGGRLPTEDEWVVAADSAINPPRRYPWGDTGAVCRRAAWGLESGPCASGASPARGEASRARDEASPARDETAGADTVGAHPDGDTPLGLHDMAGNVAEWVLDEPREGIGAAKGGSWRSALAADLRVWARLEVPPSVHDARVGFRCVYAP